MRYIFAIALCLYLQAVSAQTPLRSTPFLNTIEEIQINNLALTADGPLFCPGVIMVNSCGDGKCDAWRFENEETCPADCTPALVKSYNFQTLCTKVSKVLAPKTVADAVSLIATAHKQQQKVKIIGEKHSASDVMCTDGIVISTQHLNKILGTFTADEQTFVKVEPGVKLFELTEYLHEHNLALGFPLMGFNGVSIAGAIATGSHGSSPKHDTVISNYVEAVEMITSTGEQLTISRHENAQFLKAVRTNLGLLGMVTSVTLRTQPQFNLHVKVSHHEESELLEMPGYQDLIKACDYGQFNWFPGVGKVIKTCGTRTDEPAHAGAHNRLLDPQVPDIFIKPFKSALQLGACYNGINCLLERARYEQFKIQPPFMKNNDKGEAVFSDDLVGPSHRMMSSYLTKAQSGFFQMDWEVAVPEPYIEPALKRVKQLLEDNQVCSALIGLFIRFTRIDDYSLIAHAAAHGDFEKGKLAAFIELPVYVPTAFSKTQYEQYFAVQKEFTRILVTEFHGIAHPAKNREWVFQLQAKNSPFADNLDLFKQAMVQLDASGMFENSFAADYGLK